MAELADALDLGSSSFGVQVRFLLSAPLKRTSISYWSPFNIYLNAFSNPSTYALKLIPLTSSMSFISGLLNSG